MKLVCPKEMTTRQTRAFKLCLASKEIRAEREDVRLALTEQIASIEEGVRIIDRGVPVPKLGKIDILAVDGEGRLILADVCEILDAPLLCKTFAKIDWVEENREAFEHFHPSLGRRGLRTWLIAGVVSPEANSLIKRVEKNSIEVFEYHCLFLAGENWLVVGGLEPSVRQEADRETEGLKKENRVHLSKRPFAARSVLTEDEIGDFFGTECDSNPDDEVTSRQAL